MKPFPQCISITMPDKLASLVQLTFIFHTKILTSLRGRAKYPARPGLLYAILYTEIPLQEIPSSINEVLCHSYHNSTN